PAVAIMLDFLVYGHRMDATQVVGVAMIFLAAAGVSLNWTWRLPGRPRPGAGTA
ncbi:MAG: EamA family transporter, partial [Achromobacter sp.]